MIDDDIAERIPAQGVIAVVVLRDSAAKSHIPNHHIVRVQFSRLPGDADAVSRRSVTVNRDVWSLDIEWSFEMNDPSDAENDNSRTGCFARFAKGSRAAVVQAADDKHSAAAPAETVHSTALGAGERGDIRLRQILHLQYAGNIRLALFSPRDKVGLDSLPRRVVQPRPFLLFQSRLMGDCIARRRPRGAVYKVIIRKPRKHRRNGESQNDRQDKWNE